MKEVTEIMMDIAAHGHAEPTIGRLVDIDERIWNWMANLCVHRPVIVKEVQGLNMQTGEPHHMSLEQWLKVIARLDLTEEQVNQWGGPISL